MSPPVSRNDKAADCQGGNNDSCTPQLLGTSTASHLPRHPTGTSHYSPCQDIYHWDSLLFPLPPGKATYTYTYTHSQTIKAVDSIHHVSTLHVISSETHTYTTAPHPPHWRFGLLCADLQRKTMS